MELFIILELTKDEEIFNCDKDLNRIGGYDERWATYYLLTADDVESIKNRLGDRVVTLKNEYEEFTIGKYHILSADEVVGQYEEGNAWDEEMERWNDCYGNGEFLEAMDEKYDGGYNEDVRRRAFEKSRILEDFTNAINEIWETDYEEWWSANKIKKQYVVKGVIHGTYNDVTVDLDVELTDAELARIKGLIKEWPECKDLRQIVDEDFPDICDRIDETLIGEAYKYFGQEFKVNNPELADDEIDDIELTGEEYACPIPKEWYAKYTFEVMIAQTYSDEDIEVEIPLSEKEVARIKQLIAENVPTEEPPVDEDTYAPPSDLLQILEDHAPDLFKKFWGVIMPPVFIEMLINGLDNGHIEQHDDDEFDDYYEADFDEVYDMYGDDIELEHSSSCICRIPEEWSSNIK